MARELPDKYKTCDWLWNYGSIGLTKEHIKRLNNAINILESINEHTDVKYLKEIKDKLLEDTPEQEIEKTNTDALIKKACEWLNKELYTRFYGNEYFVASNKKINLQEFIKNFKNYMLCQ